MLLPSFGQVFTNTVSNFTGVYINNTVLTWFEAKWYCFSNYGTSLASIHSISDLRDVLVARNASHFYGDAITWIGLNDIAIESQWEWTDGSSTNNSLKILNNSWDTGEPNNFVSIGEDCVCIFGRDSHNPDSLNDFACNHTENAQILVCNTPNGDSVNWRPIFKLCSNVTSNANSSYDLWSNSNYNTFNSYETDIEFILNDFNGSMSDIDNTESCNYRSLIIDDWNELYDKSEFDSVRISLYKENVEVAYFLFEANHNSNSWFSQENLFDTSYYLTITSQSISTFDIVGMMSNIVTV